jgi:colanic acid/amylovoran biosynthesis glycosyltransferase
MRVAFLVSYFPSLSETFILDQITGLIDRGCDIDIFSDLPGKDDRVHPEVETYRLRERAYELPSTQKYFERAVGAGRLLASNIGKSPGVQLRSLNVFSYGQRAVSLRLFYEAVACLSRGPYDVVHCHFGPNGLRGLMLRDIGALQGRLVTSFYGYDLSNYVRNRGRGCYSPLFSKGDLFLALSESMRRTLIELGCPEEKILVHHLGVDLNKFRSALMRSNGGAVKILTIARLVQKKGIEYGIRAVAQLANAGRPVKYTIAGDGPLHDQLQRLIRDLGMSSVVKLEGWRRRPEVAELLADADILLAPSVTADDGDQEGTPVALMEAMAAGVAVISTHHSGIPEVIENGVSGFVVPVRSVDALSERLRYLIEHPQVRLHIGEAGRAAVQRKFDIGKLNDRLVQIYRDLSAARNTYDYMD